MMEMFDIASDFSHIKQVTHVANLLTPHSLILLITDHINTTGEAIRVTYRNTNINHVIKVIVTKKHYQSRSRNNHYETQHKSRDYNNNRDTQYHLSDYSNRHDRQYQSRGCRDSYNRQHSLHDTNVRYQSHRSEDESLKYNETNQHRCPQDAYWLQPQPTRPHLNVYAAPYTPQQQPLYLNQWATGVIPTIGVPSTSNVSNQQQTQTGTTSNVNHASSQQ